jgi:GNAT superfamily N-acetyltransferase
MEYTFTTTDSPDQAVHATLFKALIDFNESQTGPSGRRTLAILIQDSHDKVCGGLWGYSAYGWLVVEVQVVPKNLRGRGVGTELLMRAENEAIARGCHGVRLDTFEFQARGFYEGLGYECFGELADYPTGHSRFFMKKALPPAAS